MFRVILEERKQREVDPTIAVVRECLAEAGKAGPADAYARHRMEELLAFMVTMSSVYDEFRHLPSAAARGVLKLRGKVRRLFRG